MVRTGLTVKHWMSAVQLRIRTEFNRVSSTARLSRGTSRPATVWGDVSLRVAKNSKMHPQKSQLLQSAARKTISLSRVGVADHVLIDISLRSSETDRGSNKMFFILLKKEINRSLSLLQPHLAVRPTRGSEPQNTSCCFCLWCLLLRSRQRWTSNCYVGK